MNTEQLEEIRKRAEAATEGPWEVGFIGRRTYVFTADRKIHVPKSADEFSDAIFIASAREDIPALLAEVERLWAENEEMRIEIEVTDQSAEAVESENEWFRTEVERLQALAEELESIALWATRRLRPHPRMKGFAYDALEKALGREVDRV